MSSLLLPRAAVASVWLYQGLWCKLLGRVPHHREIVRTVPFLNASQAHWALAALGSLECVLAAWVLSGIWGHEAALMQTILLGCMNVAGLFWGSPHTPPPLRQHLPDSAFILLPWIAPAGLCPPAPAP